MAKAVIFDFDGVLVDTEPLFAKKFVELMNSAGYPLHEEELRLQTGHETGKLFKYCNAKFGEIDWTSLLEKIRAINLEAATQSPPIQTAIAAAERLSKNFPMAVASNSHREAVLAGLQKIGVAKLFSAVVTWDDVEKKKPHPEPYLKACALLGFSASECVAIEDSLPGITSAKAAGCKVIAFKNKGLPEQYLKEAELVTADFGEVTPEFIERI